MGNGYFQLVSDKSGFGVKLFAPSNGGEPVRVNELTEYLSKRDISYDIIALRTAVSKGETVIFHLADTECPKDRGMYQLSVSDDYMTASVRFHAPAEKGEKLTVQEFLKDLNIRQISSGILESNIRNGLENNLYCTDIAIAEGTAPRQGTDAIIEYYFNTDLNTKPTQREDGSVDFFNLNTVNHCRKGDVLARLIPEDAGEYGVNILGNKIKPRDVKKVALKYSNNIQISEDKTVLTSLVDGHVTLVDGKVFVGNLLELENVDNSTGNVEYEGSVKVNGNVMSNFSVRVRGDIIVDGVVEGAYLEAGGNIVIARGMNGMSKGSLKAEGNIIAKYLENVSASAGGYIATGSILHCEVMAGDEITVDGKRGFITGGRVCATKQIKVKNLGSPMGASTVVEVGADPVVKQRFLNLQKEVAEVVKAIRSVEPIIASYAAKKKQGAVIPSQQMQYLVSILKLREEKKSELQLKSTEMNELQQMLEQQAHAQVIITGEVYPGTKVAIGDLSIVVPNNMKYCKFVKLQGEIKMTSI